MVLEITAKMFWRSTRLKPNIIHCHDTPVLPLGVILKWITGAKIIYDAHELESERNGLSRIAGKITLFVEKRSWRFIDRLIVVSPSILSWYNSNIGFKKSAVVLNSPLISHWENSREKNVYLREKFSIPEGALIFIYNGIFTSGRGIDLITNVFRCKDIQSHVVFLGYGDMKEDLLRLSKKHSKVHVHDAVAHQDVVQINQSADVGLALIEHVSLSDYFCLPNKLFEYAFAGIPVLTSKFPDMAEIVREHNLGECSDVNYESIYQCIKKIETEKSTRKADFKDLYALSWQAQAGKLNSLYSELTDEIGEIA